ncbi:hypothetical protein GGR63_002571 [Xanthomonas sp. 3272]|uniref:hypothetical protein n=1 Tax=Xanthomonas arboricola TaxID=56448 RepID=UPI001431710C|nr:hypothetical protein [Xanthomonas arboricola]NJC02624.1 hypothetical protein [Xanthomonas arboricola]
MITMGIRVKPGEVTFAIFDSHPKNIVNVETLKVPKALSTPEALKYIRNAILDIIREYNVAQAGLRTTESQAKKLSVERVEIEGVIQEAFASSALESYYCGQISKISALVGMPRTDFKQYVDTKNYEEVENWDTFVKEEREAVFAALGAVNAKAI